MGRGNQSIISGLVFPFQIIPSAPAPPVLFPLFPTIYAEKTTGALPLLL